VAILYMSVMSGSLAYYLYFRGARTIEISEVALFGYLQPVFSVPLAVYWLGEELTPMFITGAGIIAVGIAMASYKKRKLKY